MAQLDKSSIVNGDVIIPSDITQIIDALNFVDTTDLGVLGTMTIGPSGSKPSGSKLHVQGTLSATDFSGITPTMAGLGNVDNTSDILKPVSTAQATAISTAISGVTKTSIGLPNVDNTSDINKPVSTATQTSLDLKVNSSTPIVNYVTVDTYANMLALGAVSKTTYVRVSSDEITGFQNTTYQVWTDGEVIPNASSIVTSVDKLLTIPNPQTGQSAIVKSYHEDLNKGGGTFIYDNVQADSNDYGTVLYGWVKSLTSEVTVEDFGAKGYPFDDMGAFQRASNYLYSVGGGVLKLGSKKYYLSEYTGADVNNGVLFSGLGSNVISKAWLIPPNVTVEGDGAEVNINGGASVPYGIISVLAYCGNETPFAVNSAVDNTSTVYLSNTSGLTVGMKVQLCRGINDSVPEPSTPSQERSPSQFVTIKSINPNTSITFVEGFIHSFEAVSDLLTIYKTSQLPAPPENIFINNVYFSSASTLVGDIPYILISRVINTGLNNVTFDGVAFSFCQCIKVRCGKFTVSPKHNVEGATIESCSDVTIESFEANGNGSTDGLGGLFLTDNCRLIKIGKYTASNYQKTGFAALYSVDVQIEQMTLINCGTSAIANDFPATLSVGFPAFGLPPQYSKLNYILMRNLGVCKVRIKDLIIKGSSIVPIRAHDVDLTIDNAYIEFASTSGLYPLYVGQSGLNRADPTYYPKGGQLNIHIGNLEVKTISGTSKNAAVSALNGSIGYFKAGNTTVNGNVLAGSSTITVIDGMKIKKGDSINWLSTTYVQGGDVLDVSGNIVTLSSPISIDIDSGSSVWSISTINAISGEVVNIDKLTIDGVLTPSNNSFNVVYPEFTTGSGPYNASFDLTVPSDGEWSLQITNLSDDKAHYEQKEYLVTYYNGVNPLSGITEKTDIKIRINATIDSATILDDVVTVVLGSYYSGKNCSISYKWVQKSKLIF